MQVEFAFLRRQGRQRPIRLTSNSRRSVVLLASAVALIAIALSSGALRQARAAGGEPLRPNLVADPPDTVSLEATSLEGKASYLLRFNGYVHNAGSGALDVRGRRAAPQVQGKTEKQVNEEVERAGNEGKSLPAEMERELASPPMEVFQRLFTTSVGQEEANIERPHVDEHSPAEIFYVSADGHHHWHLQHVAKYSLWNAAKTAEVSPAQKVGFCLEDSEHVETGIGPKSAVYADNVPPYRDFCQQYRPNATSLFEGISPGWRDAYKHDLTFQWVDVSNVLPGEYWLREDINPSGVIKEAGGGEKFKYAASSKIIPGYDATPQLLSVAAGEPRTVTLTSRAWHEAGNPKEPALGTPRYTIVTPPAHGTLSAISKEEVTYTPEQGFSGVDSFTFSAADSNSQFPHNPALATVSLEVGQPSQPLVTIEGLPPRVVAGTSVQLRAHVSGDTPEVSWSASAGSITPGGVYTAPAEVPPDGLATITATSSTGAHDQRSTEIIGSPTLLAGDPSTSYTVGDQTHAGREESFAFTAKASGSVEELQFRTAAAPNTGITGLSMGLFADNAGKPGAVLAAAGVPGRPPADAWVGATVPATHIVAGTRYWLGVLPLGESSAALHFNAAAEQNAGSANLESLATGLTEVTAESEWATYNQGPAGFQALGQPAGVVIEDAPLSMSAGSSVQLQAHATGEGSQIGWQASAGSITPAGLFTAPSSPPPGGLVTITATSAGGAQAQRTIEITEAGPTASISISGAQGEMIVGTGVTLTALVGHDTGGVNWSASAGSVSTSGEGLSSLFTAPSAPTTVTVTASLRDDPSVTAQAVIRVLAAPVPAPAAEIPGTSGQAGFKVSSPPGVARPRAMLMGRQLVISTSANVSGRLRLSAYLHGRRLGTCATETPAGRSFTCRINLRAGIPLSAHIRILASLRAGHLLLHSALSARRIPQMRMVPVGAGGARAASAAMFWCSPSTLRATLVG